MPLSPVNNSIIVQNWFSGVTYPIYEITAGINTGNISFPGPMYWSTIDNNTNHNPSGQFVYAISSYSRSADIATVNFTYTGNQPNFARGSLYAITGLPDVNMNATGMVLNTGPNGGTSLYIQFINPGPVTNTTNTSLGAVNSPEPAWTTGFFWTPTYSTQIQLDQAVITTRFEPTYEQRSPQGVASNSTTWNLNFNDRLDEEVKGMLAFVQNMAGSYSTPILIPPSRLFNNPNIKYVLGNMRVNTKSYQLSDVSITARQVFEF